MTLTFMTAALPDDLMIYSRPVTYVTWTAQSIDNKEHKVAPYLDASAEITGNTGKEIVALSTRANADGLTVLKVGTKEQPMLAKKETISASIGGIFTLPPRSRKCNFANHGDDKLNTVAKFRAAACNSNADTG